MKESDGNCMNILAAYFLYLTIFRKSKREIKKNFLPIKNSVCHLFFAVVIYLRSLRLLVLRCYCLSISDSASAPVAGITQVMRSADGSSIQIWFSYIFIYHP